MVSGPVSIGRGLNQPVKLSCKSMSMHFSLEEARRFLSTYHFTPTNLAGVFARLGTVQYDPLNPVGRNPDLVLQARVPGYRVDDWQQAAYTDRLIYDGWDKQACLIPTSDWPHRALTRELYRAYHDRDILSAEPEAIVSILQAMDEQGPIASLEFENETRYEAGSWYGQTKAKRILRAMWACGMVLTHHRQNGRHYYDRPERVIPPHHYDQPLLMDEEAYHRWIIARRVQAVGLLRPTAEAAIWSACGTGSQRKLALTQLVEEGTLTSVQIGEKNWLYYMLTSALPLLNAPLPEPRVIFLGPLDSLLWDRKAIAHLFGFEYTWEVYKPAPQRRWGYYVLPVFYKNRFVARLDSRLDGRTWVISRWWWEPDVTPDDELRTALHCAMQKFLDYLRAEEIRVESSL